MSLDFKDITAEVAIGDLLSPKSSASSNPIQSLSFAPIWSLVMGSPSAEFSPKSDSAMSPSIDAPVTDYRPTSQAMGGPSPAAITGQQAPGAKPQTMTAGLLSSPILLLGGLAAVAYFLLRKVG